MADRGCQQDRCSFDIVVQLMNTVHMHTPKRHIVASVYPEARHPPVEMNNSVYGRN